MTSLLFEKLKIEFLEKYFESKFAREKMCVSWRVTDVFNSSQSIEVQLFASRKLLVTSQSLVTSH